MHIEVLPIAALSPRRNNARTHSRKQVRQIADSINQFGFTNPILIDGDNRILAGHGRLAAAKLLKIAAVPCVRIGTLSPDERRAYVIADNKLALNAGWDEELLGEELETLLANELTFDIGVIGFSTAEIDALIEGLDSGEASEPAEDKQPDDGPPRCHPGDIWQLGRHRLICGDAVDRNVVAALMRGELADLVFAGPLSNLQSDRPSKRRGSTQRHILSGAADAMSRSAFTALLQRTFENLVAFSVDGSIHFVSIDWRRMQEILAAGEGVYGELKNLIVWVKDKGASGPLYRSRHALIFAFKKGTAPNVNGFASGGDGHRTDVWEYREADASGFGRRKAPAGDPSMMPVELIADAIKDASPRGAIVLDLFGGAGATLIAAHKTGRRCYLVERDPVACDRIIRRFEVYAKDEAEQVACGLELPALSDAA